MSLTVTVTDRGANFVMGLPPEAFKVIEGKQASPVRLHEVDEPMSIGLLIDTSASMEEPDVQDVARPKPIADAVKRFLRFSNQNNEYFVMTFDKEPRVLIDWRKGELPEVEIAPTEDKHLTKLYDACATALEKLRHAPQQKRAIVLFSDGLDSGSKTHYKDLRHQLEQDDTLLYAVAPHAPSRLPSDVKALLRETINREGQQVLGELIQITGGFVYYPETKSQLDLAAERIAVEMRHQYRLAFQPANAAGGALHRITVEITPPTNAGAQLGKLNIRTRRSYYLP